MTGERLLVCGGRDYTDAYFLGGILDAHHRATPIALLISGGASGADSLAVAWADSRHVNFVIEYADWENEGRAAGPKRNQRMIDKHAPTYAYAFAGGIGTDDMVRRLKAAGIPCARTG